MPVDVDIPELGESVSEVTVLEWLRADGDYVDKDEPICTLETDKANVDLPAPSAGLLRQLKKVDDTLSVGDVLAQIEEGAAPAGDGNGATVQDAPAVEVAAEEAEPAAVEDSADVTDLSSLSPAVRRLVEENGLDPSQIEGTGRGGRLIKQDVLAVLKEQERDARDQATASPATEPAPAVARSAPAPAAPIEPAPPPAPVEAPAPKPKPAPAPVAAAPAPTADGTRREPMSRIRKRIAQRLTDAQRTAAMLTTFNEVDLSQVMALRKRHKERFQEKHGVSLGLMSFFSRATIIALQDIPAVNASVEDEDIVYHDYVNLGIAVSSERGLMVPIVRHAHDLSMAGIEGEIKRLALAARDNKLTLDELSGGTFTITNGGVFGSMMSTPILTPPQTGILGARLSNA
ncbi:MAG TPA: 2-oxo acid dehydrogenase subunit E2 [Candidatus Latescibacteria bacterium]|jgi:2-oxoglutarate dehydrogenase E2 component (dihydrolipoamide succinyltransferase)|nr:2-oxo acid dehydrogenase subunit E2 [Candidatus Latescibacterota bacterium]HJP29676.1 2-oxo acid dehydrogenase subunit E2 [Candidatus Latescibacterota bacterium]